MTYSARSAPAGLFLSTAVLDALGAGLLELEPLYAPHDPATLVSLRYVSANLVAQRLLDLPSELTGSFGVDGPQATALFAFCRGTCWAGEAGFLAPDYVAADGSRWRVVAQRHGAQLLVCFTEMRELVVSAGATEELRAHNEALAHTQGQLQQLNAELEARVAAGIAEAQLARADTERRRERLEHFFAPAPAAVCVLGGPELVLELVNSA